MGKPKFSADDAEQYITDLCIQYRDTRNKIFKEDNDGRESSNQIFSDRYQKFLGMEIATRKILDYFSKFDF